MSDDLIDQAAKVGIDNFMATTGRFPDQFQLLQKHAPAAFAGYGLIRNALMKDKPEAALDLKTKELVFAVLDTLHGDLMGAKAHALLGVKLGLTLPELAEGMVQVIMVGGITTWNNVGQHVMRACEEAVAAKG
jgi:alkylhydroperoxidase/carboxymuconolactone decarboxylase family protein YurZ